MTTASLGAPVTDRVLSSERPSPIEEVCERLLAMGPAALEGTNGHFGLHAHDGSGTHVLARDPLGVAKLFFAVSEDGEVDSSNFLCDLLERGHAARAISSVPSGHVTRVVPRERNLSVSRWTTLEWGAEDASFDEAALALHAERIRAALHATFRALARALAGAPTYVTLSGGLDSTTIAVLAREHLGPFTAITFAIDDGAGPDRGAAADLEHAARAAKALGVPHEVICVRSDSLVGALDEVLVNGQDWRDFNVHCGLVNAALARWIEARHASLARSPQEAAGGARPVVITGDVMNELVADYTPVRVGDRELYSLPRMSAGRTRRFLVQGLDTGDREVGIFARRGVDCVQPYALCASAYAALPDRAVESPNAKQALARAVMGDRIPEHVYARPKVRAQVGSSDEVSGTLKALLDAGIDSAALESRFESALRLTAKERRSLMRAGMYRFVRSFDELAPGGATA